MLESRFKKHYTKYSLKPDPPEEDVKKYKEELVTSTSDRIHYFPDQENRDYDSDESDDYTDQDNDNYLDYCKTSRQFISLKEVKKIIKKEKLNEDNIFFTASRIDDNLILEVINVQELNEKEKLEAYNTDFKDWENAQQDAIKEEERRIQNQIESLQAQMNRLKKC